jgi:flavorubredoxin
VSEPTPQVIRPDVHLIRSLPDLGGPVRVALNSLVLTGADPVLVDTGAPVDRDRWWAQVESVVDPGDVRAIFLSHDDADHHGNLVEALERCPEATLITSWLLGQRLAAWVDLPLGRCRWVNDGERFSVGGRDLVAVRPPAYDAPTTRGLFDSGSGVYWGSDCFGTPVPHPADEVAQLDRDVWDDGFLAWHRLLSPWATQVEPGAWRRAIDRVAALDVRFVASAHGPVIARRDLPHALDLLGELPGLPELEPPTQRELEAALALAAAG